MKAYGKELILDLHDCDTAKFNRESLSKFLVELCDDILKMERCDLHFWDYQGDPEGYKAAPDHLAGTSAIQFITTSNVTIHTLDRIGSVYLNIFSCADFDYVDTIIFCKDFFKAHKWHPRLLERTSP